jgi:hypothetical protein
MLIERPKGARLLPMVESDGRIRIEEVAQGILSDYTANKKGAVKTLRIRSYHHLRAALRNPAHGEQYHQRVAGSSPRARRQRRLCIERTTEAHQKAVPCALSPRYF